MKTLLRTLARFKTATILNIVGLSVAFTSITVILMQVEYDLGFDKSYPASGLIYQLDYSGPDAKSENSPAFNQAMAATVVAGSPHILCGSVLQGPFLYGDQEIRETIYDVEKGASEGFTADVMLVSDSLPVVFGLEIAEGSLTQFMATRGSTIISQSTARKLFGRNSAVGRMISLRGNAIPVMAVYEDLPENSTLKNGVISNRGPLGGNTRLNAARDYYAYVRIDSPEHVPTIEQTVTALWNRDRKPEEQLTFRLTNLHDRYFVKNNNTAAQGNLTAVYSLLGIALIILLVAMINFVNFATSMIPLRIRHINTRKVLGCPISVLRLQQCLEAVILSFVSALVSFCAVYFLSGSPVASLLTVNMAPAGHLPLLSGILLLSVGVGVVAGIYPAWYSTSFPPALVLKGSFGLTPQGRKLRFSLIAFQYCISLILIISALFVRQQYQYMQNYDIGMERENILSTSLTYPMFAGRDAEQLRNTIETQLKAHPDIADVTFSSGFIVSSGGMNWETTYKNEPVQFTAIPVYYNFLSFMGMSLEEGRGFLPSDQLSENGMLVFNETARKQFGFEPGSILPALAGREQAEVVGIAADFNFRPLSEGIKPLALYVSKSWRMLDTYVKVRGNHIQPAMEHIRATLLAYDPGAQDKLEINLMDQRIGQLYKTEKNLGDLIFLFSLLSVFISTVGAFGLILFETQFRRKEIGVRKVFGASVQDILGMFNRRYARIVVICFVIAAPLAWQLIVQWQSSFAYKAPVGIGIFLIAFSIVLLITVITVTLQCYRVATANPIEAFKVD